MDEKTLFDGRLHFHREASDIRMKIYQSIVMKDNNSWINLLTAFFSLTSPYMNSTNRENIRKKLNSLGRQIILTQGNRNHNISTYNLNKDLNLVFEEIMTSTKKMWLPIEELNTEWDDELFFKGTG